MTKEKREYVLFDGVVLRDRREQFVYDFRGFTSDAATGHLPLIIPIEDATLPTGDYSLKTYDKLITCERKSKADLFSSLSQGRERLEREFQRMQDGGFEIAHFICECDWREVIEEPPPHTKFSGKSIFRTMTSWVHKYPRVHWHMCPGRAFAERTCFRLLQKFADKKHREKSMPNSIDT